MGKNWRVSAALSGAAAAWLIYDMATATEYPSPGRWRYCNGFC